MKCCCVLSLKRRAFLVELLGKINFISFLYSRFRYEFCGSIISRIYDYNAYDGINLSEDLSTLPVFVLGIISDHKYKFLRQS